MIVSYFYKVKNEYKVNNDAFLSSKLSNDKKYGYVEVNKDKGKYYVEMMYNYAKIEALVDKDNINKVVLNASYILSTIKFNDNVIALMLNEVQEAINKYNKIIKLIKFINQLCFCPGKIKRIYKFLTF